MKTQIAKKPSEVSFSYSNLSEITHDILEFHKTKPKNKKTTSSITKTRINLAKWAKKFHQENHTLNQDTEKAATKLEQPCLLLMSAHQPNLFAYSGVFRKISLMHALANDLERKIDIPVVCFFGFADQDFTDDRWVKVATLPDVERREGFFELRANLPKRILLTHSKKPSRQLIETWKKQIQNWYIQKNDLINKAGKRTVVEPTIEKKILEKNFQEFWTIVEEANLHANNFADFNAFLISKIVNEIWAYPTLFARFSECQQIFEDQFEFLIKNFKEYSQSLKAIISPTSNGGVFASEFETLPFWYHDD